MEEQFVDERYQHETELNNMIQKYNIEKLKNQKLSCLYEESQTRNKEYEHHMTSLEDYHQQMEILLHQQESLRNEQQMLQTAKHSLVAKVTSAEELQARNDNLQERSKVLKEEEKKLVIKRQKIEEYKILRKEYLYHKMKNNNKLTNYNIDHQVQYGYFFFF